MFCAVSGALLCGLATVFFFFCVARTSIGIVCVGNFDSASHALRHHNFLCVCQRSSAKFLETKFRSVTTCVTFLVRKTFCHASPSFFEWRAKSQTANVHDHLKDRWAHPRSSFGETKVLSNLTSVRERRSCRCVLFHLEMRKNIQDTSAITEPLRVTIRTTGPQGKEGTGHWIRVDEFSAMIAGICCV